MRQETIVKTYLKFNELRKDQQAKVLDKLRYINVDHDYWSESTIDDFKTELEDLGFSDIEVSFSGFWSQGDGASFTAKHNEGEITKSSHRYCHEMTMQCDDDALLDMARDKARQLYRSLKKDYEYLTSNEAVIETIEANDYEFDSETLQIV